MGRTEKSPKVKDQCGKNKGCVSEATISKLLNEFSCTEFLTNPSKHSAEEPSTCSKEEPYFARYDSVVSSLKHLHLKRPVDRRTKWKDKKGVQQRAKTVLGDKYNLAVAATCQKSLLWPGKLNCVSNSNKLHSDVIIQPSRLSMPVIGDKSSNPSSLQSSFQTSSSHEKARIAESLHCQKLSLFDDSKKKGKNPKMSFSKLSKTSKVISKAGSTSSGSPTDSLSYRKCPAHNVLPGDGLNQQRNNTNTCVGHPTTSQGASGAEDRVNLSGLDQPSTSSAAVGTSSSSTSISSGLLPERSCSEEMRMEESNVNELASYFEDLCHIPRKMSVMAEMMYA